jgi:hypothetical protein
VLSLFLVGIVSVISRLRKVLLDLSARRSSS